MSLALVERLRQALFALAGALALWAAWVAGRNFRAPALPIEEKGRLERPFPAPKPPRELRRDDRTLQSFHAITDRRLVPEAPVVEVVSGPPPFKLMGTTYNDRAPQDSTAIVMDSRGGIRSYRPGQTVEADQAKLLTVIGVKARFLWRGREIELGPDAPKSPVVLPGGPVSAAPPGQTEFTVTPKEWGEHFTHLQDYYNMVKLDANIEGGQKNGLRISFMDEKCPARQYGFQQGDILYSVNGKSLTNLMEAVSLVNSMASPKPLAVDVGRGGKRFTVTIRPAGK